MLSFRSRETGAASLSFDVTKECQPAASGKYGGCIVREASPNRTYTTAGTAGFRSTSSGMNREGYTETSMVGNEPGNPAALSGSLEFRPVVLRPTFSSGLPLG